MENDRFSLVFQLLMQTKQEQDAAEEQLIRSRGGAVHAEAQAAEMDEIAALRRIVVDTTLPTVQFYTTTGE